MERIRIPNHATRTPVALTDVMLGAPFAARALLGVPGPGQFVAAAALGYYGVCAARDWYARRNVRYLDFTAEFGSDVGNLTPLSEEARRAEMAALVAALNAGWTAERPGRAEIARRVGERLTAFHASLTGQEVVVAVTVRDFTVAKLIFPFALGAADPIGGDVAIFKDAGVLEPHVIAHELAHRMGYLKELHAQVLAYLALRTSEVPWMVQAARAERLHRHVASLSGPDPKKYREILEGLPLREELAAAFRALRPEPGGYEKAVGKAVRPFYNQRMKWTGQNGLSDYDAGFTALISAIGGGRQPASLADI